MDVLADDHRLQPDVHHPAFSRTGRDAAPDLYLSGSAGLGLDEHGLDCRRVFHGAASLVFVWNLATSLFRGKPAGDNPWNAWTLEWATTSPPPQENFHMLPPIRSRRPLWDDANPDRPDPVVGTGRSDRKRPPEKNKAGVMALHHFGDRASSAC